MAGSIGPQSEYGSFVPTTFTWELSQLQDLDIDPKLKDLLVRLYQNINLISLVLNTKDSALYPLQEFVNGQQFFANPTLDSTTSQSPTQRQAFRLVINFGTLPNATTKSVAHGLTITSGYSLTRLYGAATKSDQSEFIPIPYTSASAVNQNIELNMDDTNVNITTGVDQTAYTISYVVIEYIKQ